MFNNPLKDYEKNAKGEYVYKGDFYVLKHDKPKSLFLKLWFLIIGIFLILLLEGFVPYIGMLYSSVLILSYCVLILMWLFLFRAYFIFASSKTYLTARDFEKSIKSFPVSSFFFYIFSLISFVYSFIYGVGDILNFCLYLLCLIINCFLVFYFNKIINSLNFEIEEGNAKMKKE